MAKPYKWKGKLEDGTEVAGEAFYEVDVKRRADSMGCTEFTYEANPEYTDADLGMEVETPEIVSHTASDRLSVEKTDKQVLAEANTTLFNQLDALKNKCLGVQAAIIAWNTDQHVMARQAKDEGLLGREYTEPAWMELVRDLIH